MRAVELFADCLSAEVLDRTEAFRAMLDGDVVAGLDPRYLRSVEQDAWYEFGWINEQLCWRHYPQRSHCHGIFKYDYWVPCARVIYLFTKFAVVPPDKLQITPLRIQELRAKNFHCGRGVSIGVA